MVEIRKNITNKSSGRRILSDIVVQKRTVAAEQMFKTPTPSVRRQERKTTRILKNRWKLFLLLIIVGVGGLIFSVGTSRMEIRVNPKTVRVSVNKTLALTRNFDESGKLPMRTVAIVDTEEGTFDGRVSSVPVEKKAKGTVVIFNKSSEAPQVLVATTRLSAPDGKIYRIPRTITVPGYRVENKEIIPGSKEIEVMADASGAEYNIGLVDFTIPGFAGGAKFKTIFGRSKTPMQGGYKGAENSVVQEDLDQAVIKLTAEADARASALLQSKISADTILIKQSVENVVTDQAIELVPNQGPNKFKLTLKSEARGATVDKDQLIKFFAEVTLPKPFRAIHFENLTYELTGYKYDESDGQLKISGEVEFESVVDPREVKKLVTEKSVSKSKDILAFFAQLASVEVRFKPFWFKYPPTNPERIDIILPLR